jgi:hypothetical protein
VDARLERHRAFVERRRAEGSPPEYDAEHYEFPVTTSHERELRLYDVVETEELDREGPGRRYRVTHHPR